VKRKEVEAPREIATTKEQEGKDLAAGKEIEETFVKEIEEATEKEKEIEETTETTEAEKEIEGVTEIEKEIATEIEDQVQAVA
jgi:hypothetical protein